VADPRFDDVGMTFWAMNNLAQHYLAGQAADRAVPYANAALDLIDEVAGRDPDEPEYQRWRADALARLAEARAAAGDPSSALARLDASIKVLEALHEALPSDERRRDLKEALESALKASKGWSKKSAERKRWTELLKGLA